MKNLRNQILLSLVIFLNFSLSASAGSPLDSLAIQEGGRVKPFQSFAQEMLEIVYGKKSYEKRQASEIVMTWLLSPEAWKDKEIFEVRNHDVLKELGLPKERRYFKGDEIFDRPEFQKLIVSLNEKREAKEKLSPMWQAVSRMENQFFVFQRIASGELLRMVPPKEGQDWRPLSQLLPEEQKNFIKVSQSFVDYLTALAEKSSEIAMRESSLKTAVVEFSSWARSENEPLFVESTRTLQAELLYNQTHPFRWAYIFYFLTAIAILLIWILNKESFMKAAWVLLTAGFILHTLGFALRCYIMERPPVSNMYETVIWVSWGTIVFSVILELVYKYRMILFAGTLVGLFGLVIADFSPAILDPTLQPLEPVLRSNYWLTIHVMTITISYAAFFLAFGLGDLGLYYYFKGDTDQSARVKAVANAIYKSVQIGVLFLAPGIILGGIWADYSWGRFWGWDPKETWALIALLGYLAMLHARYAGLVRNFGMVVSAITSFSLVIMAWYGVNFILGAGLHSYGFGAGGVEYVSAFILLHAVLVAAVFVQRKKAGIV